MYDTINLWLGSEQAGRQDLQAHSERFLQAITAHSKPDGEIYYTGSLGNLRASVSMAGISFKGSLAKHYLRDNFHTLTRGDTERAIEMLSDEVQLPIDQAKVQRIDIAQNFLLRYEPKTYYAYLGECRYYDRLSQPETLYYNSGQRTKLFYDKVAEGRKKGETLPEVWTGQNVLRYEMRYTARLPHQFSLPEVTGKTLYDERFYIALVRQWIEEYKTINKINLINFNIEEMSSPKDFKKQLELIAVNAIGHDRLMQIIDELRAKKAFDKPEYYSRLKRDLRELCSTPDLTTSSDMVAELDKKVEAARQYYR